MAINFPNSPSNGDVFGNFTYDTSIPGWRKTPENSASLPAGTIVQWPGATAPANWLICDGSAVSRTAYASLFAAIGIQYGAGDGTSTFNLPNLKGRVSVGYDSSQTEFNALGKTGGAKTHTLTVSEMPSHNHTWGIDTGYRGSTGFPYITSGGTSDSNYWSFYGSFVQNTGGGGAHNNLQPYIVLNYIIKTSAGVTSGDSELATRVGITELDVDTLEGRATTVESKIGFNASVTFTASTTWTVPTLANKIVKVTVVGGGGGGGWDNTSSGGTGGTSTFTAGGTSVSAGGGAGGVASKGNQQGTVPNAGLTAGNGGGGRGGDNNGQNAAGPGGGGDISIGYVNMTGITSAAITIGAGGAAGGSQASAGARGEIIVEYGV